MDIKGLLNQELEAAKKAKQEEENKRVVCDTQAANLFQPITAGIEQLKSELSEHSDIKFYISTHSVTVKIGGDEELHTYLYGTSNLHLQSKIFPLTEITRFKYDDEVSEIERNFDDAASVVSYIVKKCATYLAYKKS